MSRFRFALPFLQSSYKKQKPYITISRVQTFLGNNFYPRLNNIYLNTCQAIAKKNYRHLSTYLEPSLSQKIITEINEVENERFKIKIKTPKAKIASMKPKKNLDKYFKFRQSLWSNEQTKIGLTCNVYFGSRFERQTPFENKDKKSIKVGQFRYLIYDSQVSALENCLNWYRHQTFQFIIRYRSKTYLQVCSFDERQSTTNNEEDQQITSEIVLKCGSEEFNYVITDINGLSSAK